MKQSQEKPDVVSQQVSHPAGEATGSDLPPEEQGGSHLPDISEPPGRSLSEQSESGPQTVEQPDPFGGGPIDRPVEQSHKCFVCGSPNHHACGCEAKEMQRQIKQDDKSFRSQDIVDEERMEKEMDSEDAKAADVLKNSNVVNLNIPGEVMKAAMDMLNTIGEYPERIIDQLSDINSNLEILVKLEKERAGIMKDIRNVGANQN